MIKWFSNSFAVLRFYVGIRWSKLPKFWKPKTKQVSRVTSRQQFEKKWRARYEMHALLKEGDTYKLGEATVTLAKFGTEGKAEVQAKIEAAAKRRAERWAKARERGIDLMMMKPDELEKLQIKEWLTKRENFKKVLEDFDSLPEVEPPSGEIKGRQ